MRRTEVDERSGGISNEGIILGEIVAAGTIGDQLFGGPDNDRLESGTGYADPATTRSRPWMGQPTSTDSATRSPYDAIRR